MGNCWGPQGSKPAQIGPETWTVSFFLLHSLNICSGNQRKYTQTLNGWSKEKKERKKSSFILIRYSSFSSFPVIFTLHHPYIKMHEHPHLPPLHPWRCLRFFYCFYDCGTRQTCLHWSFRKNFILVFKVASNKKLSCTRQLKKNISLGIIKFIIGNGAFPTKTSNIADIFSPNLIRYFPSSDQLCVKSQRFPLSVSLSAHLVAIIRVSRQYLEKKWW